MCFSDLSSLVGSSTDWSNFQTETFQGRNRESGIGNPAALWPVFHI
jgi:hypothetical protein